MFINVLISIMYIYVCMCVYIYKIRYCLLVKREEEKLIHTAFCFSQQEEGKVLNSSLSIYPQYKLVDKSAYGSNAT